LPFLFSASASRALTSSSSFSSISFQILASSHLADSFASLLASASSVRHCCFNLFYSSSLSYIHIMQWAHLEWMLPKTCWVENWAEFPSELEQLVITGE
jgi:hypothetical protein